MQTLLKTLFVVLLCITIPCAGLVTAGWLWVFSNSRTVGGKSYMFVIVAGDDEIVRHPFWKKTPTPAELNAMVAALTARGYGLVYIDDQCRVAGPTSGSPPGGPGGFSERQVRLPSKTSYDRVRALGQLKSQLDEFVRNENLGQ